MTATPANVDRLAGETAAWMRSVGVPVQPLARVAGGVTPGGLDGSYEPSTGLATISPDVLARPCPEAGLVLLHELAHAAQNWTPPVALPAVEGAADAVSVDLHPAWVRRYCPRAEWRLTVAPLETYGPQVVWARTLSGRWCRCSWRSPRARWLRRWMLTQPSAVLLDASARAGLGVPAIVPPPRLFAAAPVVRSGRSLSPAGRLVAGR